MNENRFWFEGDKCFSDANMKYINFERNFLIYFYVIFFSNEYAAWVLFNETNNNVWDYSDWVSSSLIF